MFNNTKIVILIIHFLKSFAYVTIFFTVFNKSVPLFKINSKVLNPFQRGLT